MTPKGKTSMKDWSTKIPKESGWYWCYMNYGRLLPCRVTHVNTESHGRIWIAKPAEAEDFSSLGKDWEGNDYKKHMKKLNFKFGPAIPRPPL